MTKREKRLAAERVLDAAWAWWKSKRPESFNECCHLNQPAVNTTSPVERNLANAVAIWVVAVEDK